MSSLQQYPSLLVIFLLLGSSLQDTSDNQIDEPNIFAEAAAEILKSQNAQSVGGMLNNLLQSDGGKQIGDILNNDVVKNLGSMIGKDPNLVGNMLDLFQPKGHQEAGGASDGFDPSFFFQLLGNVMGQDGKQDIWSYLPMFLQTINSFVGPEADERARAHAGHAELLPPFMEKIHLMFDHFLNTDFSKKMFNTFGAEKWVKVFADEDGKFTYKRFIDMMENHSFRKHWIKMITDRLAGFFSVVSDPTTQKKYLVTFQHFVNSIIRTQGFPKSTMFDPTRPTESISALINYLVKSNFQMKIDSKKYVKPAVEYTQDLLKLAQSRGMFNVDTETVSNKLADTINLEVIEPIARVNRAYRFAQKVPACDLYVMCLVNQDSEDANLSLPGLRPLLSKSTSFVLSWFLSADTKTPFWSFYTTITEEENCRGSFVEKCDEFHEEEIRVRREIVHSEL